MLVHCPINYAIWLPMKMRQRSLRQYNKEYDGISGPTVNYNGMHSVACPSNSLWLPYYLTQTGFIVRYDRDCLSKTAITPLPAYSNIWHWQEMHCLKLDWRVSLCGKGRTIFHFYQFFCPLITCGLRVTRHIR